jgi:hypothetical protein
MFGRFVVYRIGDAVASRNIYTAILDPYRLRNAISAPPPQPLPSLTEKEIPMSSNPTVRSERCHR